MHKSLHVLFIIYLFALVLSAEDTIREDRETSFRKSIDAFGKLDEKEVAGVKKFKQMFRNGEISGQVRSMYAAYKQKSPSETDTYATALGGMFKYELANFNGFNAAISVTGSQDLSFATGDTLESRHNDELSSLKGNYIAMSEAYINYTDGSLNIRLGRQMIDTPLADTDDSRMIPNTFEAYMLTYEMDNIVFTLGNVQKWQGAGAGLGYNDAGVKLNDNWIDTEGSGTSMIGLSYLNALKFRAWYYDIQKSINASKASYFELGYHKKGDIALHGAIQYLHESEAKNSGVQADIYGALVELIVYNAGVNIAYNKSKKHQGKRSFSGIGGGSLYTSMDTMLLDEIVRQDASSLVAGFEYEIEKFKVIYAYGDFVGEADSLGNSVHIVEQNLGLEYTMEESFSLAAIYVKEEDKQSVAQTANDWDRFQLMIAYNF